MTSTLKVENIINPSSTNTNIVLNTDGSINTTGAISQNGSPVVTLGSYTDAFAVTGYQKLPTGLIIQWGRAGATIATGGTIIFPVTFPNGVFEVLVGWYPNTGNGYVIRNTGFNNSSVFYGWDVWNTAGNGQATNVNFIAIGY